MAEPNALVVDAAAEADAVALCQALVRVDTTNHGAGQAVGEAGAAAVVLDALAAAGITGEVLERAPGRSNVLARVPGRDAGLPPLLVQGHLDVVPADPAEWSRPPFCGDIVDGYLWGRGSTDMKDFVAMILAVLRAMHRHGTRPRRDLVLAFVADEEDQGAYGAHWLAAEHAERFAGCVAAISESGAYPYHLSTEAGRELRIYPVGTAERGTAHLRLTAHGRAGHGSRPNAENPVVRLVEALGRLAAYEWPIELIPTVRAFLERASTALDVPVDLSTPDGVARAVTALGKAGTIVLPTIRNSATPTVLDAGYKVNVIPGTASAQVDVRVLPGTEDALLAEIDRLLGPHVTREFVAHQPPVQADVHSPWFDTLADALRGEDPEAVVLPYCMGGGTDAKAFAPLGIECFGFAPLWLPPGFPYREMAHGVDERVPVEGLHFGTRVLGRLLADG